MGDLIGGILNDMKIFNYHLKPELLTIQDFQVKQIQTTINTQGDKILTILKQLIFLQQLLLHYINF